MIAISQFVTRLLFLRELSRAALIHLVFFPPEPAHLVVSEKPWIINNRVSTPVVSSDTTKRLVSDKKELKSRVIAI